MPRDRDPGMLYLITILNRSFSSELTDADYEKILMEHSEDREFIKRVIGFWHTFQKTMDEERKAYYEKQRSNGATRDPA